ncbi:MipA/OmpV family protein [Marinimicrobium sp. ABcell2]|uniref:MipA/OmpV family protein n=1 Tax=Marinimicrobium sp. ABcell2 TaxID=3069751 RepID=UPI0027B01644|nr:MipA/OmpV family protein [Marinimicrobium sp. ABcell2]MDQ2076995.1 MipA/OmpV family protein [Marinimicrobium sp. ABcell2]
MKNLSCWLAASLLAFTSHGSLADRIDLPPDQTWSAGIGIGTVAGPDYRGSETYRAYVSPVPYLVYRGRFLRSDDEGVRGEFWATDEMELTLSVLATLTPDSHKNELREGMRPLDSTVELGPALDVNLTGEDLRRGLLLHLPVRAIIAFGRRSPEHVGWMLEPHLMYRTTWLQWDWSLRAGPAFGSGDFHSYYYSVPTEHALPERPAYRARSGYSGLNSQVIVSRRKGSFWYGLFARYNNLQGTKFRDSPLVETEHNVSGGLAVSWIIF